MKMLQKLCYPKAAPFAMLSSKIGRPIEILLERGPFNVMSDKKLRIVRVGHFLFQKSADKKLPTNNHQF